MKVDKHISELLYEHDCVIIPDLGGFVANYAPAKIHPAQHTFLPPSKNIIFNKNLKNNDGLLANHIASTENTSYPEALKYIHLFTSSTNAQLKKGVRVAIEEVGTLYLDVERNIQFEPETTNYLLDAFGLTQFQSPAIKRDNIGKRVEKEFKDRAAIPSEKRKINVKRYVTLAIAMPLAFGMIWISLKTDLLKNINYSNLNPLASKEAAKYTARTNAQPIQIEMEDAETAVVPEVNDTVKIALNTNDKVTLPVTAEIVNSKTPGVVKADSTSVVINSLYSDADFKFHLITGCFQIQDNAERFVMDLQKQNFSASIIGKRNGLYVVSCGDYATREEAYDQLKELKKSQPEAWLLAK
ncbi:MAG: SPOR domain-containing protein [Bacteroidota bacterium]